MSDTAKVNPAAVVGRVIGNVIPLGLMAWAWFEVDGVLRVALCVWVVFVTISMVVMASVATLRNEVSR